jgi:predicted permease
VLRTLKELRLSIRSLFRRRQEEQQLHDELQFHLERQIEQNLASGMPPEEARYAALRLLGNMASVKEQTREAWGFGWLERLRQDLKYGLRTLRHSPWFTAAAVLTLALGIGSNTAIFSLVNAVLLRPISGVQDPSQLVSVYRMQKNDPFDVLGYPDYADYRDRTRSFSGLAAQAGAALSLSGRGVPERLIGDVITGNYFSTLGVRPARGRLIGPEDDAPPGAHPIVVLSYILWARKFGADPDVIGRKVVLNGYAFTVAGVAPRQFAGTIPGLPFDVWVPMSMLDQAMPSTVGQRFFEERAWGWLRVFGRLKPGVSTEQAQAEMTGIAGQLAQSYPSTNAGRTMALVRGVGLDPDDRANLSGFFSLLAAGVALLLLIACANVAGLLLVRAGSRQREIAIRLAVGASRGRVVRQLLVEGFLLALAGGALGLLLAPWAVRLAVTLTGTTSNVRDANVSPDARVFGFTLLASLITGIAFALMPALRSSALDLVTSLKQGAPGSGWRRSPLQRLLAAGQVGLSFVLLLASGLLLRSLQRTRSADPGFETRNLLLASVDLSLQGYSPAQGESFYRQLVERLEGAPGVVSASVSTSMPPDEWPGAVSIFYPGQEPPQEVLRGHEFQLGLRVNINRVSPTYFRTLGIPLLQGRPFTNFDGENAPVRELDGNLLEGSQETASESSSGSASEASAAPVRPATAPGVVIVNQKLAEQLWPSENPIGKRISWPTLVGPLRPPLEVVGVAGDSRVLSLVRDAPLLMYLPLRELLGKSKHCRAHRLRAGESHVRASARDQRFGQKPAGLWNQNHGGAPRPLALAAENGREPG